MSNAGGLAIRSSGGSAQGCSSPSGSSQGSQFRGNIESLGEHYDNLTVQSFRGTGQIIGADTREAAHGVYQKVISTYEQGHDRGRVGGLERAAGDRSSAAKIAVKDAFSAALASPEVQRSFRKLGKSIRRRPS
jgi:hypothetical protein